jgi:hypothetical protein
MDQRNKSNKLLGWKNILILLCLILIILIIFRVFINFNDFGLDNNVFCGAVSSFSNGDDPYYVSNLEKYSGNVFPFVYFPLTLIFFIPLCLFKTVLIYLMCWVILLLFIFLIAKKIDRFQGNGDTLFLITILITGFATMYENLLSGNVGLVEGFLFSIVLLALVKGRYYLSSIILGMIASLKIFPLLFGGLFLFGKRILKKKVWTIILFVVGFLAIHLISAMLFPEFTGSYIKTITGTMEGQFRLQEETGGCNPSSYVFLKEAVFSFTQNNILFYLIYASFCLLIAIFFVYRLKNHKDLFFNHFCLGILGIMLIWTRLKPYSFVWALLPIYFLTKNSSIIKKILVIMVISMAPNISILLGGYIFPILRNTIWLSYTSFFSLLLVYIILIFNTPLNQ